MSVINGIKGAYQQPIRFEITEQGAFVIITWVGTRAAISQIVPLVVGMGGTYELDQSFSGAADKITARFSYIFGTAETPVDTWELFAVEVEKDLLQTDNAAVNSLSDDEKRIILANINNPQENKSPALPNIQAMNIYLLMLNGLRSLRVPVPTLRHTQTVSNNYTIPLSYTNTERIISTASLITQENLPTGTMLVLPVKISNRTGFEYGWFKKYPTLRKAAWQKAQLEQEWEFGLWPTQILGAVL